MKILILGGTRCVGRILSEIFYKKNYTIHIISRRPHPNRKIKNLYLGEFKDLKLPKAMIEYDVVFDFITKKPNDLKKIFKNISFKKYIFISTTWVSRINESLSSLVFYQKNDLSNFYYENKNYIKNKIILEHTLSNLNSRYKKKSVIIRLPLILGNNDPQNRVGYFVLRLLDQAGIIVANHGRDKINFCTPLETAIAFDKLILKKNFPDFDILEAILYTIKIKSLIKFLSKSINIKKIVLYTYDIEFLKKKFIEFVKSNPFINEYNFRSTNKNIFKLLNIINKKKLISFFTQNDEKVNYCFYNRNLRNKEINFIKKYSQNAKKIIL